MSKKKVFIRENGGAKSLGITLNRLAKKKKLNLEIKTSETDHLNKILRGHRVYLLHLSNIDENDLIQLRKNQPLSLIYLRTGKHIPKSLYEVYEDKFFLFHNTILDNCILEYIKNYEKISGRK